MSWGAPIAGALADVLGCRLEDAPQPVRALLAQQLHPRGLPAHPLDPGRRRPDCAGRCHPRPGRQLKALGVPVVSRIFPQTDHGFDLLAPEVSPSSLPVCLERWLALVYKNLTPRPPFPIAGRGFLATLANRQIKVTPLPASGRGAGGLGSFPPFMP
jgi:hypothetical protein